MQDATGTIVRIRVLAAWKEILCLYKWNKIHRVNIIRQRKSSAPSQFNNLNYLHISESPSKLSHTHSLYETVSMCLRIFVDRLESTYVYRVIGSSTSSLGQSWQHWWSQCGQKKVELRFIAACSWQLQHPQVQVCWYFVSLVLEPLEPLFEERWWWWWWWEEEEGILTMTYAEKLRWYVELVLLG